MTQRVRELVLMVGNAGQHGKDIVWWENRNKYWEAEYQNGKRVR